MHIDFPECWISREWLWHRSPSQVRSRPSPQALQVKTTATGNQQSYHQACSNHLQPIISIMRWNTIRGSSLFDLCFFLAPWPPPGVSRKTPSRSCGTSFGDIGHMMRCSVQRPRGSPPRHSSLRPRNSKAPWGAKHAQQKNFQGKGMATDQ